RGRAQRRVILEGLLCRPGEHRADELAAEGQPAGAGGAPRAVGREEAQGHLSGTGAGGGPPAGRGSRSGAGPGVAGSRSDGASLRLPLGLYPFQSPTSTIDCASMASARSRAVARRTPREPARRSPIIASPSAI